jgi:hypothetical protein
MHGLLELRMDERMRLAAMTLVHVPHLNATIALWRADAGSSARIDHAGGWRQAVKPIATAAQALDQLVGPDAHEPWGRQLIDTANREEGTA